LLVSAFCITFAADFRKKDQAMKKKSNINQIIKLVAGILAVACATVVAGLGLQSCNVVRTITNQSEYYQKGDTSVMIQTRTVESYDASKKL
jgi:biotin carboxylase